MPSFEMKFFVGISIEIKEFIQETFHFGGHKN